MNIREVINKEKIKLLENNIEDALIIEKILMQYVLKKQESYIITNCDEELDNDKIKEYEKYINKVIMGTPIQYITNNQEFMKLQFYVDENVLIPQPDTEILVEEVIKESMKFSNRIDIMDLCTGSGAIGISLAKYINSSKILCTDISMKALQIAKLNAEKNLVHRKMEFILSDLFENIIDKKFDIIVSNPPYIKTSVIKKLDKQVQNEPIIALDGGTDGLDFYRVISNEADMFLKDNGILFLEIGYDQKEEVMKLLESQNIYKSIECKKDLSKNDRVIIARK